MSAFCTNHALDDLCDIITQLVEHWYYLGAGQAASCQLAGVVRPEIPEARHLEFDDEDRDATSSLFYAKSKAKEGPM